MRDGTPSSTARHIAFARAHLTWLGVIDDPYAEGMLRPRWARAGRALRHRPLTWFGRNRLSAQVGARTLFFDEAVTAALDAGVRQVVVVAAGYDSRAWRLARPGVRFFEVDHPATQDDKRRRAPSGGPEYVAADLAVDRLADVLPPAGFVAGAPTVFTVEGLTQYLPESAVRSLLTALATLGGPGSRLVTNFGLSFDPRGTRSSRLFLAVARSWVASGNESFQYNPAPEEAERLLCDTGWTVSTLVSSRDLGERYLAGSRIRTASLSPRACMTSAIRA